MRKKRSPLRQVITKGMRSRKMADYKKMSVDQRYKGMEIGAKNKSTNNPVSGVWQKIKDAFSGSKEKKKGLL